MPNASLPSPATRGILVDRRCWSVDLLENLLTLGRQQAIFNAVIHAAELNPADHLLDVGCGTGDLVRIAAHRLDPTRGGAAHGLDATAGMIERARQRTDPALTHAHFHVGVVEQLPFPDHTFHVVTSTLLFHHLPHDLQQHAIDEITRVLRPGGRIVIADYARPHGLRGQLACLPHRCNFYEYVRPQLKGALENLLQARLGPIETTQRFLGYIPILRAHTPNTP